MSLRHLLALTLLAVSTFAAAVPTPTEHLGYKPGTDYKLADYNEIITYYQKLEKASPRLKLLFDIYHVQVMHGDVIRRIEQNREIIGHVHTAGNPGRGELDDRQEINYPAVMRKLLEIKYAGHVGQEFIPTRNPLEGLRQAVRLCDV